MHRALTKEQPRPVEVLAQKRCRMPAFAGWRGHVASFDPHTEGPPIYVQFPGMSSPVRFFAHELTVPAG